MKNLVNLLYFAICLNIFKMSSQGIIVSPDNSVNAVLASSPNIPKTDSNATATWTPTNAYWGSPLIYRSRRFPDNGSGAFPFNEYGELMIQGTSHGNYNKGISFLTWNGIASESEIRLRISPDGRIGIGTISPDEKLTVKGKIHTQEVRVDMTGPLATTIPDYVFAKEYKLKTLEEVEDFINKNSHLPEIPSAKEIEKSGLMLAEMNMSLLRKIEELTLYMIEQEKKNTVQSKEIESLKKENLKFQSIMERIVKLENTLN